jgi:hypothetical protein
MSSIIFLNLEFYIYILGGQASQKTALILAERGYVVKERGVITVKGKGDMRTFFVLGRRISRAWRTGRGSGAANNSLAEVRLHIQ